MAVSKRTRFEVLRRDNHTCRYCRSTENPLTVDHVTPVSLGGTDDPSNLVAACKDCNAGKSSSSPDAPLVAQVEDDALRWARAREVVLARRADDDKQARIAASNFALFWQDFDPDGAYLPFNYEARIHEWMTRGISHAEIHRAREIAWGRTTVPKRDKWAYICGVINNWLRDIEDATDQLLTETWADFGEGGDAREQVKAWELNDAPHRLLCNAVEGTYDYLRDAFDDFQSRRDMALEVANG